MTKTRKIITTESYSTWASEFASQYWKEQLPKSWKEAMRLAAEFPPLVDLVEKLENPTYNFEALQQKFLKVGLELNEYPSVSNLDSHPVFKALYEKLTALGVDCSKLNPPVVDFVVVEVTPPYYLFNTGEYEAVITMNEDWIG